MRKNKKSRTAKRRKTYQNRNSRINTRSSDTRVWTYTAGRDEGTTLVSAESPVRSQHKSGTFRFIAPQGVVVTMNGRQMRTLFNVLSKHYGEVDYSW